MTHPIILRRVCQCSPVNDMELALVVWLELRGQREPLQEVPVT
jgi:hypothetical protein